MRNSEENPGISLIYVSCLLSLPMVRKVTHSVKVGLVKIAPEQHVLRSPPHNQPTCKNGFWKLVVSVCKSASGIELINETWSLSMNAFVEYCTQGW